MAEIKVKRPHYHDGGGVRPVETFSMLDQTLAVCSCGRVVRYTFRGEYPLCGWYWVRPNLWQRWKWRREIRAAT